jgi:RNA polymerase sigma factor (sigma-70 family)
LEALWKSLQCHNENYNQKFTTTLYRFVDWECKRRLRRKRALKNNPFHIISNDFSSVLIKKNELSYYINEKIDLLDKDFSILLRQRFFDGFSIKEIGVINNCTPSIIRYKLSKAIEKLKSICSDF